MNEDQDSNTAVELFRIYIYIDIEIYIYVYNKTIDMYRNISNETTSLLTARPVRYPYDYLRWFVAH